jgi:uncharacterized protein (DUF1800 family)
MIRLSFDDARHLISRTGLGVEWAIVNKWVGRSREEAISHLVGTRNRWTISAPELSGWASWEASLKAGGARERQAKKRLDMDKLSLQQWWLKTMLETPYPIIERMTMFWHGHFTSSLNKVNQPDLFLQQNQLFRKYALGNFADLLKQVVYNPAMLLYLDGADNKMGASNENFARELLELYTVGNYKESEVKVVTRALTGLDVDRVKKTAVFNPKLHDPGTMTFRGQTGNLTPDDIVNILLRDPATAKNIATKFWYEFVSDEKPDANTINAWAAHFKHKNYEISALLEAVLTSKAFWHSGNRGKRIKAPAELLIGTLRTLPIKVPVPKGTTLDKRLVNLWDSLGQTLFVPPTPAGWPRGKEWIDTHTMQARANMLAGFTNKESKNAMDNLPVASGKALAKWLLAVEPSAGVPADQLSSQEKIYQLLQDSAYQLI